MLSHSTRAKRRRRSYEYAAIRKIRVACVNPYTDPPEWRVSYPRLASEHPGIDWLLSNSVHLKCSGYAEVLTAYRGACAVLVGQARLKHHIDLYLKEKSGLILSVCSQFRSPRSGRYSSADDLVFFDQEESRLCRSLRDDRTVRVHLLKSRDGSPVPVSFTVDYSTLSFGDPQ